MRGVLYVVAVPIGSFEDITLRALRILHKADLIAAETPTVTQRLLAFHGIDTPITSYGPGNIKEKVAVLTNRLQLGVSIALVSNGGSPVIADPGCCLVTSAHRNGIQVISVPGPSALTAAVTVAGLPGDSFSFDGKLPETRPRMRRWLVHHLKRKTSTVAFCTPSSLMLALSTIAEIAPRRLIVLVCDLTTRDELVVRGTVSQVCRRLSGTSAVRDVTLIIKGRIETSRDEGSSK